jgi:hypothetical protein
MSACWSAIVAAFFFGGAAGMLIRYGLDQAELATYRRIARGQPELPDERKGRP